MNGNSRSSSIYSDASSRRFTSLPSRNGTQSSTGRPASYTPSYMSGYAPSYVSNIQSRPPMTPEEPSYMPSNYSSFRSPPRRKPVGSSPASTRRSVSLSSSAQTTTQLPPGLLFVFIAASPHSLTTSFLELLLKRQTFSGVVIVGNKEQETAIKELKIAVYALIGRMSRELGVHTYTLETWNEASMEFIVQQATKSGATGIQGVLCTPQYDSSDASSGTDLISLSRETLQQSWDQSVGFLHAICKCMVPQLLSQSQLSEQPPPPPPLPPPTESASKLHNPFLIVAGTTTDTTVTYQIAKSACDALIDFLEKSNRSQNLIVGHADVLLVQEPEPEPEPEPDRGNESNKTSLAEKRTTVLPYVATSGIGYLQEQPQQPIAPSESPTELWGMWAMQNELSDAD